MGREVVPGVVLPEAPEGYRWRIKSHGSMNKVVLERKGLLGWKWVDSAPYYPTKPSDAINCANSLLKRLEAEQARQKHFGVYR